MIVAAQRSAARVNANSGTDFVDIDVIETTTGHKGCAAGETGISPRIEVPLQQKPQAIACPPRTR